MKYCNQCTETKQESAFYRNRSKVEGLSDQCKDCCKHNAAKRRAEKPELTREEVRVARERNRERYNEVRRGSKRTADYRAKNADELKAYFKLYRKANRPKLTAYRAERRASQRQATPSWANKQYIDLFYRMAALEADRVGEKVHVDHIVPLSHPLVCGLHCEHNLQLLTASANLTKSNRVWPNMPQL